MYWCGKNAARHRSCVLALAEAGPPAVTAQ
jgi:hypothetical protein